LELQCFEIKTEADSSDITEYPHDDMPSTGMFVFIDGQFPCAAFAFRFHVSVVLPCTSAQTYYILNICPSLHPSICTQNVSYHKQIACQHSHWTL